MAAMNDRGLFGRWALLPGNARETWGAELLEGLSTVLGDRGFRWVSRVKTPSYRLKGGKVVETGWKSWVARKRILLGKVRNWVSLARGYLARGPV